MNKENQKKIRKSYKIFRENLYTIYLRQILPKQTVKVTKLLQFQYLGITA